MRRLGVREQPVAGPQRRAATAVDHVPGDDRAVGAGDVLGAVARAVVDDQDRGRHAADLWRDPVEDPADVVGLVVGGHEHADPVAEAAGVPVDVETAPRRGPRAPPESSLVIREPWLSARRTSRNRIRIAKIATPTIRVPFSRSNENAESSASGISVPGDDRQAERDRQQDEDIGVAERRAGARSRSRRCSAASARPTARIAVSSGGKSPATSIAGAGRIERRPAAP